MTSTRQDWSVYILLCADNSLYTGITMDIERRIKEHNSDNLRAAAYTRSRRPVRLVYHETFSSRSDAQRREWAIKQLNRRDKKHLVNNSDEPQHNGKHDER